MVPGPPAVRLREAGRGGSVSAGAVGGAALEGREPVGETRRRRWDDGILHPALFPLVFRFLRQTGQRTERGRKRRGRGRDEHRRRRNGVDGRIVVPGDGLRRLVLQAQNLLGRGAEQPLQVAVVVVRLGEVVVLGGVGGPPVSGRHRDVERDWELGGLWRGKPRRVRGGRLDGVWRGKLRGRRFPLLQVEGRGLQAGLGRWRWSDLWRVGAWRGGAVLRLRAHPQAR